MTREQQQRAEFVQSRLRRRNLTQHAASLRLEVSREAIAKAWVGNAVRLEIVEQMATKLGEDPNLWREMFGYPRIEPSLTDAVRTVVTHAEEDGVVPQAFGGRRLGVDRDRIREAIRKLELMDRQAAEEEAAGGEE